MRYSKYQMILRVLYLKFKEVESEMQAAKIDAPNEPLDVYFAQMILLNELIRVFDGMQMFITERDVQFYSKHLSQVHGHDLDKLCPTNNPFIIKGEAS